MNTLRSASFAILLVCSTCVFAQSGESGTDASEKEPAAVLELGGAGSWDLQNADPSFGPAVAVEVTPIENWLELESGAAALFRMGSSELDVDLLFKKPWTLSRKAEIMAGIGPEWIHARASHVTTNSIAGEAVLDFMYWPAKRHRFGWYLEPGFDYSFAAGHEKSMGISGGLLIAIP